MLSLETLSFVAVLTTAQNGPCVLSNSTRKSERSRKSLTGTITFSANQTLRLKNDASSRNGTSQLSTASSTKGDSEEPAKPELGLLQKPTLSKEASKSNVDETPMRRAKVLPERENTWQADSPRTDNTRNETLLPLQSDVAVAPDSPNNPASVDAAASVQIRTDHYLASARTSEPIVVDSNEHTLLRVEAHNGTTANGIEESIIEPFDVVASLLLTSNNHSTAGAYPEDALVGRFVAQRVDPDGLNNIADRPEPETSTALTTESLTGNPLFETIALVENMGLHGLERTTVPIKPHSPPPLRHFDFLVYDERSATACILLTLNLTLSVSYETKDQKYTTTNYRLPNDLAVSGHCGNPRSSIELSWFQSSRIGKQNSFALDFSKDNSSFYVDSVRIVIALDPMNFPDAKGAFIAGNSSTNLKLFSTPLQNAIHICPTETTVRCGNIVATISNVTAIAYNNNQELSIGKEEYCRVTPETVEKVNVASITGGIVGVVIVLAVVATLFSWYRRRADVTVRSELP